MSPELLDPDRFGINCRPTKQSDCYALGMVVYEVRADAVVPTLTNVLTHILRFYAETLCIGTKGRYHEQHTTTETGGGGKSWVH